MARAIAATRHESRDQELRESITSAIRKKHTGLKDLILEACMQTKAATFIFRVD